MMSHADRQVHPQIAAGLLLASYLDGLASKALPAASHHSGSCGIARSFHFFPSALCLFCLFWLARTRCTFARVMRNMSPHESPPTVQRRRTRRRLSPRKLQKGDGCVLKIQGLAILTSSPIHRSNARLGRSIRAQRHLSPGRPSFKVFVLVTFHALHLRRHRRLHAIPSSPVLLTEERRRV